ncbi:MAG: hypothetical protein DI535_07660 [Citrobacter freundii]|nr:MAG: hypothetical protein DI535_07660 [Citrobacter freundii]
MAREYKFHVYIMTNINRTVLYVGVTSNLEVRTWQHKTGQSQFTAKYNSNRLVYMEPYSDIRLAKRREWLLKRWRHEWKIELITKVNPYMEDLAKDWYQSLRKK